MNKTYERVFSQKQERNIKAAKRRKSKFLKEYRETTHKKRLNAAAGSKKLQATTPYSELWFYAALRMIEFPVLPSHYNSDTYGLGLRNPQHDHYIPDIINNTFKFLIEIDDARHLNNTEYDNRRDLHFRQKGFKTYRVIFRNKGSVVMTMKRVCSHILQSSRCTPEEKHLTTQWINKYI